MVFTFLNHTIRPEEIHELYELDTSYAPLVEFITHWQSGREQFTFKTSGSTGRPGEVVIQRTQIESSVQSTAQFLDLQPKEQILLCLSPTYIAAQIMAIRGLILDMDVHLVKPSANPLEEVSDSPIDFASLVPYQIYNIISSGQLDALSKIKNVLIGGAPLNDQAFAEIAKLPNQLFMTYGMTETVTHIALMPISGEPEEAVYQLLPNLKIGKNESDCIWIEGKVTNGNRIQTKDIVDLIDAQTFRWLGRKDYLINSGGVKIHPEQIEKIIAVMFNALGMKNEFYIYGEPNEQLGQQVVLAVECDAPIDDLLDKIKPAIKSQFSKYHVPRRVHFMPEFYRTPSGKVIRQ